MTNRGILPDIIRFEDAPARTECLADDDPVAIAIAEMAQRRQAEYRQVQLAHVFGDVLREHLDAEYARAWGAESTRRIYKSELQKLYAWCAARHLDWERINSEELCHYLSNRSAEGASPSTCDRIVAAVRWYYELANIPFAAEGILLRAALRFFREGWEGDGASDTRPPELPDATPPTPTEEHAHA